MRNHAMLQQYIREMFLREQVSAFDIAKLFMQPEDKQDDVSVTVPIDDVEEMPDVPAEDMSGLGPYFTLKDLQVSSTAKKYGLDNTPTTDAARALESLAQKVLNPLKNRIGDLRISSAYRSPEVNRRVGGATNSQHMSGEAADISAPSMSAEALANLIVDMGLPFDQLIWYDEGRGGHVHVSYTSRRENQGKTLHAPDRGGYNNWVPDTTGSKLNEASKMKDTATLRHLIYEMAGMSLGTVKLTGPLVEYSGPRMGTPRFRYDFEELRQEVIPHLQDLLTSGGQKEFIVTGRLIMNVESIKGPGLIYPIKVDVVGPCFYRLVMNFDVNPPDERANTGLFGMLTINAQTSLEINNARHANRQSKKISFVAEQSMPEDAIEPMPDVFVALGGGKDWGGPGKWAPETLQQNTLYLSETELSAAALHAFDHALKDLKIAILRTFQEFGPQPG